MLLGIVRVTGDMHFLLVRKLRYQEVKEYRRNKRAEREDICYFNNYEGVDQAGILRVKRQIARNTGHIQNANRRDIVNNSAS